MHVITQKRRTAPKALAVTRNGVIEISADAPSAEEAAADGEQICG